MGTRDHHPDLGVGGVVVAADPLGDWVQGQCVPVIEMAETMAPKDPCPICGNYRLGGGPPILHKCQKCGYVSGSVVHTDRCPGCLYLKQKDND